MYLAKSLGKNQISGNPRARRSPQRRPAPVPEEEVVASPPPLAVPARSIPSVPPMRANPMAINGSGHDSHGEDEPDPADVRRNIAAARRNMDPDHQIRRAMDAFLSSPSVRPGDPG
jgi:hypothetical protein